VRHLPTSSPPPKTPSHAPSLPPSRAALATSTAAPDWRPRSRRSTQPNVVILFGEDAYWCPLQHIQNSARDQTRGDQDLLRIGRCSLFWIQPAHALVNLSVYQSIPCLFRCIYHTTTCYLMLATCSHKGDPKIHPDAPRNACGVRTVAGWVCRVLTPWSPNHLIMMNDHYVFIMFHITYDIIVQTLSQFMPSIIGNLRSSPELPAGSTDWISLTLDLTRT
jgi:hypothetical protein